MPGNWLEKRIQYPRTLKPRDTQKREDVDALRELWLNGWDGLFPIDEILYVSVPDSVSFYELLNSALDYSNLRYVLESLNDASYLANLKKESASLTLIQSEGFQTSLLREAGSKKAFSDGWRIFDQSSVLIEDQVFKFVAPDGSANQIGFSFGKKEALPHDIAVIIGPNGVGKSQIFHQMIRSWMLGGDQRRGFDERQNFDQLSVLSYSPFEEFPVDTEAVSNVIKDKRAYKYFGFRGRGRGFDRQVSISIQHPKKYACESLISCMEDDRKYSSIKKWKRKISILVEVLSKSIDFDEIGLIIEDDSVMRFLDAEWPLSEIVVRNVSIEGDGPVQRCLVLSGSSRVDISLLKESVRDEFGVIFLKDGAVKKLSSGQWLYTYIVVNILGAIRRNSLILVDEPEIFLHASLEIHFMRMLKSVLHEFRSKAIIATHSLVVVREVPRACVNVLENTKDGMVIKKPPFETFGADLQRISSYVFSDNQIVKPYEEWITEQLDKYGGASNLLDAVGKDLNEEMIIAIGSMGRTHGK